MTNIEMLANVTRELTYNKQVKAVAMEQVLAARQVDEEVKSLVRAGKEQKANALAGKVIKLWTGMIKGVKGDWDALDNADHAAYVWLSTLNRVLTKAEKPATPKMDLSEALKALGL